MSIRDRLFWEEKAREAGLAKALRVPYVECRACGVAYVEEPREVCSVCQAERRRPR